MLPGLRTEPLCGPIPRSMDPIYVDLFAESISSTYSSFDGGCWLGGPYNNDFVRIVLHLELVHLRLARLRGGLRGASQLRCCQRLASIPQFKPAACKPSPVADISGAYVHFFHPCSSTARGWCIFQSITSSDEAHQVKRKPSLDFVTTPYT